MSAARSPLTLAFPLVATALAPDDAEACPQPYSCDDIPTWTGLELRNAAAIPVDGVLVLAGRRHGPGDPLANITLAVTRDGQPIAGALETTPHPHALVWRPGVPWQPGATYHAEGAAENPGAIPQCGAEHEEFGGDFVIDSAPSAALTPPEFTGEAALTAAVDLSLESIACCVGAAAPTREPGYCYGYYVNYEPGTCGPTRSTGYFSLSIEGEPAAAGPVARSLVYSLKVDGQLQGTSLDPPKDTSAPEAPVCITVEALDLGTGDLAVSAQQCFGTEFAADLGPQTMTPELGCPLEQCAVQGNTWNPDDCTPIESEPPPTTSDTEPGTSDTSTTAETDPGTDTDEGCACDEAGTSAPPALLLALPLLLTRRRRT